MAKKTEIETIPFPEAEIVPGHTYKEIHRRLLQPIDKSLVSYRAATRNGPANIAFINITDYKDLLDFRAGVWTSEITQLQQVENNLCVVVRISIHASDGVFSQDGSGIEAAPVSGYGDLFSNAYSQAFRRACEGHGLSRELWRSNESQEMFMNEFHREQSADPPPANTPAPSGDWSPEASNQAANEIAAPPPASDTPPAPLVDFGSGAAKKNENKLRELCKQLNAAGAPHFHLTEGETKWNSEALDSYCQQGFDKAIAQMDDDEMVIMIQDLEETLNERIAMNEESNSSSAPTTSGGAEMITDKQLAGLTKLAEMKKANESKVAGEASGNRVGTFGALTSDEAQTAIKNLTKMKAS